MHIDIESSILITYIDILYLSSACIPNDAYRYRMFNFDYIYDCIKSLKNKVQIYITFISQQIAPHPTQMSTQCSTSQPRMIQNGLFFIWVVLNNLYTHVYISQQLSQTRLNQSFVMLKCFQRTISLLYKWLMSIFLSLSTNHVSLVGLIPITFSQCIMFCRISQCKGLWSKVGVITLTWKVDGKA